MNHPILKIDNLEISVQTTGLKVVNDLSLSISCGQTLALVGESGSGKTMASMAIMGLLPSGIKQTGGTIMIGDQKVNDLTAEQYRNLRNSQVAMVMQNPTSAFDPVLSIFQHFRETFLSHGIEDGSRIKIMAMKKLAEVGFQDPSEILELYPFQMSGGMLQRVMLALALICSPPLIIADEATTDLDVVSQRKILDLLKARCREHGSALLLITHDFSVAAAMADEVAVMRKGDMVEQGSASHIFNAPSSVYTNELLNMHRSLYTPLYLKIMENMSRGTL